MKRSTVSVILVAGGIGARMKSSIPKQYLALKGKAIARHSFDLFLSCPEVLEIIVVCEPEYYSIFKAVNSDKRVLFASPGKRRQDSVYNGLQKVSPQATLVCTHDSARPLVTAEIFHNVAAAAEEHGAAVAAVLLPFTVKQGDGKGFVMATLDRSHIWEIQTPQMMRPDLLRQGYAIADEKGIDVTDCSRLIELIPHPVKLVAAASSNIKVTTPTDLAIAEVLCNPQ